MMALYAGCTNFVGVRVLTPIAAQNDKKKDSSLAKTLILDVSLDFPLSLYELDTRKVDRVAGKLHDDRGPLVTVSVFVIFCLMIIPLSVYDNCHFPLNFLLNIDLEPIFAN